MKKILVLAALPFFCAVARAASQAVLNGADALAAKQAYAAYTNNVLPVVSVDASEWNDANPRSKSDTLPANMPFQLAVGPDPADRAAAEEAIAAATNAMPPHVRDYFLETTTMGPLLQRIFRRCRPGIANEDVYVTPRAHPAVWRAHDFDKVAIREMCSSLSSNSIPMLVALNPLYERFELSPIRRAQPLVDYSDPREETTFETPFGIAIVLRAPEQKRKFRFVASAWPAQNRLTRFRWVPLSTSGAQAASVGPIYRQRDLSPALGYGEITLNWSLIRGRQDVAVFARYGDGVWGPPSIISFYVVPNERRQYDANGRISRISYEKAKDVIPFLYQNKCWTDSFVLDSAEQVTGFMRLWEGSLKEAHFSDIGEFIVETYPNGLPKVAKKVRYFTRPTDPNILDYEVTDEEVAYPLRAFVPHDRGEFPIAKPRKR